MNLSEKIKLSGRYGRATYLISATVTLAASLLVLLEPLSIPFCIIIKLVSVPIVFYLYTTLSNKTEIYFYLNMGISRNEYYLIPIAVEFIAFITLMIITGTVGHAMQ